MKLSPYFLALTALLLLAFLPGCGSQGTQPPALTGEPGRMMMGEVRVRDEAALRKLLGDHLFSLQWISWEEFGVATVFWEGNTLRIEARQEGPEGEDYVTMEGEILEVADEYFLMQGKIVTQVSFINDGKPCPREGQFTFGINFNRKYWRLQEMANPCEDGNLVDYIDVFFARPGGE